MRRFGAFILKFEPEVEHVNVLGATRRDTAIVPGVLLHTTHKPLFYVIIFSLVHKAGRAVSPCFQS